MAIYEAHRNEGVAKTSTTGYIELHRADCDNNRIAVVALPTEPAVTPTDWTLSDVS